MLNWFTETGFAGSIRPKVHKVMQGIATARTAIFVFHMYFVTFDGIHYGPEKKSRQPGVTASLQAVDQNSSCSCI